MAGASLAIAAFQLWSSYQQSESIRSSARLTARINELNANFIEMDAINAEKQGFSESARYQSIIDKTIGSQRASFAGQGVDVSFGTAAQVQAETRLVGFLNRMDIETAARNRALGLRIEASNVRLGASMQQIQSSIDAQSTQTQGVLGAAGTVAEFYLNRAKDSIDKAKKAKAVSPSNRIESSDINRLNEIIERGSRSPGIGGIITRSNRANTAP